MVGSVEGTSEIPNPSRRDDAVCELELRRYAALAGLRRDTKGPWVRIALPSNREAVTHLPVERRSSFEVHMRAIIAKANDSSAEPPEPISTVDGTGESPVSKLLGRACGTCRGLCCRMAGARNAYLESESIQLYRARNPKGAAD